MAIDDLIDNFKLFDDWEDKYKYIIDLGKKLPLIPESEKIAANKVNGCISQVWLTCHNNNGILSFNADSDAFIVKGLVAILMIIYNNKPANVIVNIDAVDILSKLDLDNHISANRRNGLVSMVEKIKYFASLNI